jgi:3-dehydroquinate dehydratase I
MQPMQPAQRKAIELNGKPIGSGRFPVICAPLVGRTRERLLAEVASVAARMPDLLEWRVDFFEGISDAAEVVSLAGQVRLAARGIPLLFTCRSMREGGQAIALSQDQVVALYRVVCASGHADIGDFEIGNTPAHVREMRELSQAHGVKLIGSFHDFERTPPFDVLMRRFADAERAGADIAKVAVMPRDMDDVLTLLMATLESSRNLGIPVVSMSMGGHGALTRLCGWTFGSAMTFAVGESSSAPGQMPIEDVEAGIAILRRALGEPQT